MKMLEKDPERRSTVTEMLTHPFFETFSTKDITLYSNASVLNKLMQFKVQSKLKTLLSIYASLNVLSAVDKS